jgi:hypothetical protein
MHYNEKESNVIFAFDKQAATAAAAAAAASQTHL